MLPMTHNRVKNACCNRQRNNIVYYSPGKIELDAPEHYFAEIEQCEQGFEVAGYEHEFCTGDCDVGSRPDRNADICGGEGRGVIDSVANHCDESALGVVF